MFHALSEAHLKEFAEIPMESLGKRLADRHILLKLTDEARAHLVKTGYDRVYSVRPLKLAIQKPLETRLGRLIIAGKVHDNEEIVVDYDPAKDELAFQPVPVLA